MKTSITLFDRELTLLRYPEKLQHKSLQAWDAADELLVNHCHTELTAQQLQGLRIYNDDFGMLGCWFADHNPRWFSDSFVAQTACRRNLQRNKIAEASINFHTSLDNPAEAASIVLLKLPKSVALLEQQLIDLQSVVTTDTKVIAAGKVTAVQSSVLALFEKYLGPTTTSLAKKKARLIFCTPSGDKHHNSPYPTVWHTDSPKLKISNLANVFARQQLDIGARLMLANLPDCSGKTIVDLGCGNGVLGLHVLRAYPDCELVFVDESYMAVASAMQNVEDNFPQLLNQCHFLVSNCLEQLQELALAKPVDMVLCNPPFHQQNTITDHIAYQMFSDSKHALRKGGELRVVGNRHLDYPHKIKRLFGGYSVVASNRKFSILSTIKR